MKTQMKVQKQSRLNIRDSRALRGWASVILIGMALRWLGAAPCARATCREGCDTNNLGDTFIGADALLNDVSVGANTAVGANALTYNTSGYDNTAVGLEAMYGSPGVSSGTYNTAVGAQALIYNTGDGNTGLGTAALASNTTGHDNTAVGYLTLANAGTGFVVTGAYNTAVG